MQVGKAGRARGDPAEDLASHAGRLIDGGRIRLMKEYEPASVFVAEPVLDGPQVYAPELEW